jgi:hypothetical protein
MTDLKAAFSKGRTKTAEEKVALISAASPEVGSLKPTEVRTQRRQTGLTVAHRAERSIVSEQVGPQ